MRIIKEIEIEGQQVTALFDTGALHSYVRQDLLKEALSITVTKPYKVALGGRVIEVKKIAVVLGKIEGYEFDTKVVPVDELGSVNGKTIDAIIGALTMEEWEIIPNPKDGSLDLSGLKRREFTEY